MPSVAYAAEVALGISLADPEGLLAEIRAAVDPYPAALTEAFVEGLAEADFLLGALSKPATRGDIAFVAGTLYRAVGLCAHAVCARAGRWVTNDKGLIGEAARQPGARRDFQQRVSAIFTGLAPNTLAVAVEHAVELVADTRVAG